MTRKLAIIGLDAASFPFIESSLDSLPTIRRLLTGGTPHQLRSHSDTLNGSVWVTLSTGTHPGIHGIYHDLQWDAEAMRLRRVDPTWLTFEPFWCELERRGVLTIVVDVPHSLPPKLQRGIEIVNWNPHDHLSPFATRPPSLKRAIRQRFGGRSIGYEIPANRTTHQLQQCREHLLTSARSKPDSVSGS